MSKKIVVIGGSVREGSYTARTVEVVASELAAQEEFSWEVFDPREHRLALPGQTVEGDASAALQAAVKAAIGVLVVSPEYHGGISSPMKLIIDNLGFPSVLEGKPVGLIGVAAGVIGAIKSLEQLRSILSHVGAIVLPGPVSVAHVRSAFDETGITDGAIEKRIRGAVDQLIEYVNTRVCPLIALEEMVRDEG